MTREEATVYWKQRSKHIHNWLEENEDVDFIGEYVEAIDMAIEALSAEAVEGDAESATTTHGRLIDADALEEYIYTDEHPYNNKWDIKAVAWEDIENAPTIVPATPTERTGVWKKAVIEKLESLAKDMENEIEDAKKHPENYTKNFIRGMEEQVVGVAHAAHEIIDMPSVTEWIPVSERLPKEMESVLVTDGSEVWEDQIEKVIITDTYRWGQCMFPVYEYEEWHWRPLPEPYKGGDME